MPTNKPKPVGTLLVVDDNKAILQSVKMLMEQWFAHIACATHPDNATAVLANNTPDVILLDMNFHAGVNNGNEGLYYLRTFHDRWPSSRIVLFTAYADVDLAVRGLKDGAADFVVKPWDNARLIEALTECRHDNTSSPAPSPNDNIYYGDSPAMVALLKAADRVAATDANVLITGENGTGKDVLAHYIHSHSLRSSRPLVTVDMGAITETLFESELFGHAKGAFTGADSDRQGRFEAANNATLFLDEIGNLPQTLQAKLLTALQRRQVTRLGTNRPIDVDIRLICATNRDLWQMVADGQFREDLLYRINTIHLEIPPLRNRPDDILPLAQMFIHRLAARYGRTANALSRDAQEALTHYSWPGNVRELEHAIEKAVIMSDTDIIGVESLSLSPHKPQATSTLTTLDEMEATAIRQAIETSGSNMSLVAQRLGISRQTLYNKMKRYGI